MDTMVIIAVNCSNTSSTVERLPIQYQTHVSRYPTDSNSNPWYRIHLNVEKARTDMAGNIQFTDEFDSEDLELDYSSTAEKIKLEIANRLHRFGIMDVHYVEGISERLSVDAAAELRQTERLGVSLSIIDYVCISRRLERMRDVQGEDEVCCAICTEGVIGEDEVTKLPCSHILHAHCLARWIQKNKSCPLCRMHFG
ncbi:hypothetical protein MKW98_021197 [Papaver atlanticum]|uniref:RING-type domain-containing protein n=1 Tax=Papaver atlanticum TaxID=357466 RepID=A0AAD4T9W9_9MAGN|nr:hypothetical protein MKW98_021197 [Papaver atlanticum]